MKIPTDNFRHIVMMPLFIMLVALHAGAAKPIFTTDNYYRIGNEATAGRMITETGPSKITMLNEEASKPQQLWILSELSGSWRIINSASNRALRYEGELVELGVNNGSDEAQLWKIDGGLITPANKPGYALFADGKGTLSLMPLSKVKSAGGKGAVFLFTGIPAKTAADGADAARRANYWENESRKSGL